MNALWAGMMLMAIIYGTFHGTIPAVTQAALDSAKEAVSLCITMLGILSFWMGLMQVGSASGLIGRMTRGIRPVLRWLFPRIPEDHPALEQIAVNCIANVLGLGWAATPAGLKAMKELKKLEESNKDNISKKSYTAGNIARMSEATYEASDMMCAFLVLNISSLQLIPINMIAYRSQYGSVNPTAVVLPAILATMISTLAGILFIKGMEFIRYNGRNKKKRRRLR